MIGDQAKSIRAQMRWLAAIGICGLLIFAAVAFAALFQIQINGPLYRTISLSNNLIADYVPPSQSLLQPALLCAKLADTSDPDTRARDIARLQSLEREFDRRNQDYMQRVPEGPLKAMMRGEAYATAIEYFNNAEQLIALVDAGRLPEARRLLVETMNPLYDRHAAAVDRIVIEANGEARATEAEASRSVRGYTVTLAAIGLLALIAVALLSYMLARGIGKQTDRLIESEERRRQQATLLESVLSSMAEGVVAVDGRGKTQVWNQRAAEILGPKPEAYESEQWTQSMGVYLQDGVTPCPLESRPLAAALRGEQSQMELLIKNSMHPAGCWIDIYARPINGDSSNGRHVNNGGVSVFRDATERKRDLAERQRREQDLSQMNRALRILSGCNASLVRAESERGLIEEICSILLVEGGYQLASVGYAGVGYAGAEAPSAIHSVTAVGDAAGLGAEIADCMTTAVRSGHAELRDGPLPAMPLLAAPLIGMGRVLGALAVRPGGSTGRSPAQATGRSPAHAGTIDEKEAELIGEVAACLARGMLALRLSRERFEMVAALERARDVLEHRVNERTVELVASKEAAESADRLKSAFLATMSHELRTPLNSIIGFTGIVLQGLAGPLNAEQTKQLGMVQTSARHLLDLINDVLDISKIEAGQLELRKERFDMRQSVETVMRSVQPQAAAKGLRLRSSVAPEVTTIFGDHRRVEQVLLNLLSNAIKFTERGEVSVGCSLEDGWFAARVTDTGIGIGAKDLAQLFRPFRQIDSGLARKHEGTGLGLSICRRLAELMGGGVSVASVPAEGSTFTFRFPAADLTGDMA